MDLKELEKIACLAFLFAFVAPVLGLLARGRPGVQRALFVLLCVLIPGGIYKPEEWGLTLDSVQPFYRGHATGFHFYFAEAVALTLVLARALEDWPDVRRLPPGLGLYFLHCALCFISIVNAPNTTFVFMAAFKAVTIAIVLVAAYHFLRSEGNLQFFLLVFSGVMAVQLLAALRERYLLHVYQVTGTFEHQNSLSMFAMMIGMVFLAAALGPKSRGSNLSLFSYLFCAAIVESTFSRAGMVIFAAGSIGVGLFSLVDKVTARRVTLLGILGAVAALGLLMSFGTIQARFHDFGNQSSGKTRELLNQAARDMVEDHPLGIGWNNFAFVINHPFPYGQAIDRWEVAGGATIDRHYEKGLVESLYFLLLAETGWQGLISFVLFILLFLWWNLRAGLAFRHDFLGALSLGIAFGCGTNYLQSTLEHVLIQPRNLMLWFILLGVTARIEVMRRARAGGRPPAARLDLPPSPMKALAQEGR